jgi:hypothetical protein
MLFANRIGSVDRVDLTEWRQVGQGASRAVFANDAYPGILIKTVKEGAQEARGGRRVKTKLQFLKRWRRFGAYMSFRRELDEYIDLSRKFYSQDDVQLPIAKIYGLVHTDRGLGLIVEKMIARDGKIAPTLRRLLEQGRLEQRHLDGLETFFAEAGRLHVVMMDCNLGNLVWVDHPSSSQPRVVCVDGTGEKSFLRLFAMSRQLNRLKLWAYRRRLFRHIARKLAEADRRASPGQPGRRAEDRPRHLSPRSAYRSS